jgi:hypothetical protein
MERSPTVTLTFGIKALTPLALLRVLLPEESLWPVLSGCDFR